MGCFNSKLTYFRNKRSHTSNLAEELEKNSNVLNHNSKRCSNLNQDQDQNNHYNYETIPTNTVSKLEMSKSDRSKSSMMAIGKL